MKSNSIVAVRSFWVSLRMPHLVLALAFAHCVALLLSHVALAEQLNPGDIAVVKQDTGEVYVVDAETGTATLIVDIGCSGFSHVILDSCGRILTATRGSAGIIGIDPATGQIDSIASGALIRRPCALAFDNNDDLIVGDTYNGLVRVDLSSGTQELLTPYTDIQDIEIDDDGNIFLLDFGRVNAGGGRVLTFDPVTESLSTLAEGGNLFNPADMTFGPDGNLLISNRLSNRQSQILQVDINDGNQEVLFTDSTTNSEGFIDLENNQSLIVGHLYGNTITRIDLFSGDTQNVSYLGVYGHVTGIAVCPMPEPSSITLLFFGLASILCVRRR